MKADSLWRHNLCYSCIFLILNPAFLPNTLFCLHLHTIDTFIQFSLFDLPHLTQYTRIIPNSRIALTKRPYAYTPSNQVLHRSNICVTRDAMMLVEMKSNGSRNAPLSLFPGMKDKDIAITGQHLRAKNVYSYSLFLFRFLLPQGTWVNRRIVTRSRYVSLLGLGFKKLLKFEKRHRHVAQRFVSCSSPHNRILWNMSIRRSMNYDFCSDMLSPPPPPPLCDSNGYYNDWVIRFVRFIDSMR